MEKSNQIRSNKVPRLWIIVFVIIAFLIVGLLLTTPATPVNGPEPTDQLNEEPSERANTFNNMLLIGDNAIYVENQQAKNEVEIKTVQLKDSGYVVIFDNNDGVPGSIIGASTLINSGESSNIVAKLDEPLANEGVYYAILHRDNGDGIFNPNDDTAIVDKDSNIVLMTFIGDGVEIE